MTFHEFNLHDDLLAGIDAMNYQQATPVQEQAIPKILEGKDLIACAQTGTGKTAAFALPILNRLALNPVRPERKTCRVLVLSPTRELSGQILDAQSRLNVGNLVEAGKPVPEALRAFGKLFGALGLPDGELQRIVQVVDAQVFETVPAPIHRIAIRPA